MKPTVYLLNFLTVYQKDISLYIEGIVTKETQKCDFYTQIYYIPLTALI